MDLLEFGRLGFVLGKHFHGGLEAGIHQRLGEHLELGLVGHQALDGLRIQHLVLAGHVGGSHAGCRVQDRLVLGRQRVVLLDVDEELQLGRAFPPAGVVVVRRNLVEAQLFIVVGTDELHGVQRTLFQSLVNIACGHVLRHHAQLGHGLAEHAAAQTHLQTLEVFHGLDFLAVPAAHLGRGVAGRCGLEVVLGKEGVKELAAVAMILPAVHLQCGQAEGHGAAEGEDGILAGEVVGSGLRHVNGIALQRIHHTESGHQLASGVHRNLELAARHGLDQLRQLFSTAEDGVQRLGEAGGQAPAHSGLGVNSRCCTRGQHAGDTGIFQNGTTIHFSLLEERIELIQTTDLCQLVLCNRHKMYTSQPFHKR